MEALTDTQDSFSGTRPVTLLYDRLQLASRDHVRCHTFLTGRKSKTERSFAQLAESAAKLAGAFAVQNLRRGDRVGILVGDNADFILTFFACVHAGLVAVPLSPPPALGKADRFIERIALVVQEGNLSALVTDGSVDDSRLCGAAKDTPVLAMSKLKQHGDVVPPAALTPDDICFIQFTSGSTGKPKGVVIDYRNVAENCQAIAIEGLNSTAEDVAVSWLPMYHDMGLVGKVLATFSVGMPCVYIPTRLFIRHPNLWMEAMSDYRGTISFGPNFALKLASKRARALGADIDLSHVRAIGCGAEPISPDALREFLARHETYGLKENALMPSYGMAEATLAVSFASLTSPVRYRRVCKDALRNDGTVSFVPHVEGSIELVSCGRAFPGHEITIQDASGQVLGERQVGQIVVQGPSVARGYFCNSAATEEVFLGGRLFTGDLGFLDEHELYVCGREKDIIIVNGANYYAQEIEWSLESVPGLREGGVAAIGIDRGAGEELVVVAERGKGGDDTALTERMLKRVREDWGLLLGDVVIVPASALPKTTSGKLRRSEVKRRYLAGDFTRDRLTDGPPPQPRSANHAAL